MARTLLVTGANGFLGRHIAHKYFQQGWDVTGLGHGNWSQSQWQEWGMQRWHSADVTLDSLVTYGREPDLIVHAAGSGSVGYSIQHPYQDFERTGHATISVLEYIRVHAPRTEVIFLSSAAVYGTAKELPIHESATLQPISPYGVNKFLAEELCKSYARNYRLRVGIIRFFSVYGNGLRKQLLWDACQKLSHGEAQFSGTGREQRDWLHIHDAVELIRLASSRVSSDCPIVNGGSGSSSQVRTVLDKLHSFFPAVAKLEFSGSFRQGDPVQFEADVSLARSWGWEPTVSLDMGVSEYANWFKAGAL